MVTSKTSKLMQVVIYMRMLDWIAGDLLPPMDICEEEGECMFISHWQSRMQ